MASIDLNIEEYYKEYERLLISNKYIGKKIFDDYIFKFRNLIENLDIENALYSKINDIINDGYKKVEEHNQKYLNDNYIKYKSYFEDMYKGIDDNIKLDEEQIKAILADEDYALIIAGAGTGKTTTMTSKVKYLVDIKDVDPSKILVMSYTKKATMELEDRIVNNFNIPVHVTTFHSLGYDYIKKIFKNKLCTIIDQNEKEEIFLEYFKVLFKDKNKVREVMESFNTIKSKKWMFGNFFKEHYSEFDTYEEFFEEYKNIN